LLVAADPLSGLFVTALQTGRDFIIHIRRRPQLDTVRDHRCLRDINAASQHFVVIDTAIVALAKFQLEFADAIGLSCTIQHTHVLAAKLQLNTASLGIGHHRPHIASPVLSHEHANHVRATVVYRETCRRRSVYFRPDAQNG
jgi:hypothetical protein